MPKNASQQTANTQGKKTPARRAGVRALKTLEDLRRLQAKLIRQNLADELATEKFKTLVYGSSVLCQAMRLLQPGQRHNFKTGRSSSPSMRR